MDSGTGNRPNDRMMIVAQPGTLDATVRHLRDSGLVLNGALRLYEAAERWRPDYVPDFLIGRVGDSEQHERLETLWLSIYHRLGHARRLERRIRELCTAEYEVRPPTTQADVPRFMSEFLNAAIDDTIETDSAIGSLVISLCSALDALAGMAALLLNTQSYGLWDASFRKLLRELRENIRNRSEGHQQRMLRELAAVALPLLDLDAPASDWFLQLVAYRHAYAHRPLVQRAGSITRGERGFRGLLYMPRNPFLRPSVVIPNPDSESGMDESEWNRRRAEFLNEPAEEYCTWVTAQVTSLSDRTLDALASVYAERSERPSLFANDVERLLQRRADQEPTSFQGIPLDPGTVRDSRHI